MNLKELLRPVFNRLYTGYYQFDDFQPLFIVGCGHSGTTLILRILASHDDVHGINYESYAFNKGKKGFELFRKWEKLRMKEGKNFWLEKTPRHVRFLDQIFEIFPKAKVIVMVRDGRDVAVSIKKRYGTIEEGIDRWILDNSYALEYKDHPRVEFLKLEGFTANPESCLKRLCEFTGIKYYPELLNYHEKEFNYANKEVKKSTDVRDGEGHALNRNWQVNQPIFKNTQRWKKEATKEDIDAFRNNRFVEMLHRFDYLEQENEIE